ncbi:beta-galactosidase [Phytoactinopolyspora mesophila]|uniref:Glycosyl hydrolase family 35 n=1 Tax=Phytoactinopolyspora mesophila TaxID=2650750 RepID=A0A7K3M640_9ACTN|nr:beta-galactosidase [Phytoactinopolyspora mesophila]NDL58487.1 glycosyl hydrolase family 35 [Phytoactinopolyspora mesophila]
MNTGQRRVLAAHAPAAPLTGHLRLGGRSAAGGEIRVDSQSLWRDGEPWFPVMGEFHYARYPRAEWDAELRKMRAGGITVVGAYVFWILHEERRGHYRWDGDRDLRAFAELCADVGLDIVARIGPWGHGEARNGGFPEWVMALDLDTRTNDSQYLDIVRPWYGEIAQQLEGLFWTEGGPVVAVQIENELHDQPDHLLTLKRMAQQAGFSVPLWTVTGWGRADIPRDEFIPVFGGYPEAAWDEHDAGWARQSRLHFFFTHVRDDFTIGSDLHQDADAESGSRSDDGGGAIGGDAEGALGPELERYPFATCELGGGMYTAYHRRPLVEAEDVAAISLVKLGSGSTWQGYYMYHGATQVIGELTTTQESHATGYPNDCPVLSYDFQAPLGEFGQVRPSYCLLRQQALWIEAEGPRLARMQMTLPDDSPTDVDDHSTLRWVLRSDGDSGYLFVNNHQPVESLPRHEAVGFEIHGLGEGALRIPTVECSIAPGAFFAWPLRLDAAGARVSATAQVVTRLGGGSTSALVLTEVEGIPVELQVEHGTVDQAPQGVTMTNEDGMSVLRDLRPGLDCAVTISGPAGTVRVLILRADQGRHVSVAQGQLYVSEAPVVVFGDGPAAVTTARTVRVHRYQEGDWFSSQLEGAEPAVDVACTSNRRAGRARDIPRGGPLNRASAPTDADFAGAAAWTLDLPRQLVAHTTDDREVLLRIDYVGDAARLYAGDQLLADHFFYGRPWEVGLRRFGDVLDEGLRLEILPLSETAPIYLSPEVQPVYVDGIALALRSVSLRQRASVGIRL